jgi:hypothetical protein
MIRYGKVEFHQLKKVTNEVIEEESEVTVWEASNLLHWFSGQAQTSQLQTVD